jgi:hypothetical protein
MVNLVGIEKLCKRLFSIFSLWNIWSVLTGTLDRPHKAASVCITSLKSLSE